MSGRTRSQDRARRVKGRVRRPPQRLGDKLLPLPASAPGRASGQERGRVEPEGIRDSRPGTTRVEAVPVGCPTVAATRRRAQVAATPAGPRIQAHAPRLLGRDPRQPGRIPDCREKDTGLDSRFSILDCRLRIARPALSAFGLRQQGCRFGPSRHRCRKGKAAGFLPQSTSRLPDGLLPCSARRSLRRAKPCGNLSVDRDTTGTRSAESRTHLDTPGSCVIMRRVTVLRMGSSSLEQTHGI